MTEHLLASISSHLRAEEAVQLAARLISIQTENPPGDVADGINFVEKYLKSHGIACERAEGEPGKTNLIARIKGTRPGPTLLLNGHIDVVPAGQRDGWSWDPYGGEIRDGFILGRGASDMKAGLAGLIVAFVAARKVDDLPGEVVLMVVCDEETGGHNGTKWLLDSGRVTGDGCIIAEPSGKSQPTIGQKGACWLRLISKGRPGHGSLSPVIGLSAIVPMARAVEVLYEVFERRWDVPDELSEIIADSQRSVVEERGNADLAKVFERVTVNVGTIRGGDKVNVIADRCEAEVDMRIPWGVEVGDVIAYIVELFESRGLDIEIERLRWRSKPNYSLPSDAVVDAVLWAIEETTGVKPLPVLQYASSDARYFREHGIAAIQYGPAELDGIHGYNERVRVRDVEEATRVYAAAIVRFLTNFSG